MFDCLVTSILCVYMFVAWDDNSGKAILLESVSWVHRINRASSILGCSWLQGLGHEEILN